MRERLRRLVPGREGPRALAFLGAWVVCLVLVWTAASGAIPRPATPHGSLSARLLIDGGAWEIRYDVTTSNATVFRLLREASAVMGFEVRYVEYGWPYQDVFVTSINGTRNDQGANLWWQFCVNGVYAAKGAANQGLGDGDRVKWAYAPPGGDELCR